jgi:hypothetical protein
MYNEVEELPNGCIVRKVNEGFVMINSRRYLLAEILWSIYHRQEVEEQVDCLPRPICGEKTCVNLDHPKMMSLREKIARAKCHASITIVLICYSVVFE